MKQVPSVPRNTKVSARAENEQVLAETLDKIGDFSSFCNVIVKRFSKDHHIIRNADDIYISKTDAKGRSVIQFLHFQQVNSAFRFLHLICVEKNGKEIPKIYFSKADCLQKNSLISKWSQFDKILSCISEFELRDTDYLNSALEILNCMSCSDSPHYQFLYSQLQLLLCSPKGRRFDRNMYVFAAELHNISPAAYRMLRN